MPVVFEWDATKAKANWRKHGVNFDEASTVFEAELASIFPDPGHSRSEFRELVVGHSVLGRLLFVSFVERPNGRVRIISARKATRREQKDYAEGS
jgi:uncharacterized protein